jgi:hypothetical protein
MMLCFSCGKLKALALAAFVTLLPASAACAGEARTTVRALTDAFNKHDIDGMRTYWSADLVWYDVDGDQISVVAKGVDAMDAGMRDYFKAYPDVRSTLSRLAENGPYVTGVETARWTSKGAAREQSSVVVYEIRDAKVRRVWYYPAEK